MNQEIIETQDLRYACAMAVAVMTSSTRVGRLLGEPGTGKTAATLHLASLPPAALSARMVVRICCRRGQTESALARKIAECLGVMGKGSTDAIINACEKPADGVLFIFDEANHLRWQHLERLRYLSDECGAGILLVGTDLLQRTFIDGRNAAYLAQLSRRIGTRQVRMGRMDVKQTAAYVLQPRFGAGVPQPLAKQFHSATKGYWGESIELAEGCQRVMTANGVSFNADALSAAIKDLADRRAAA